MQSSSHTAPHPPQAFAEPALARAGTNLAAALFGDCGFAEIERRRRPLVRRRVGFSDPPDSNMLWALIDAQSLSIDDDEIRLVETSRDGLRVVPPADYAIEARRGMTTILTPLPARARALYERGATISFQRLDRRLPALARQCAALSAHLGHPTQCSAYLSPPGHQGLDIHHDTHDVVVVQLEGTKAFQLFQPIVDQPVPRIDLTPRQVASARPAERIELAAGDLLYMPRGVPHCAIAGEQDSLHLTIGILAQSWASLVEPLAREIYFIELLRRAPASGEIFEGATLRRSATLAADQLIAWLQTYGAERLAALACEAYVASFAGRPTFVDAPPISATAIEPAPDGDYYKIEPGGRTRVSPGEIDKRTNIGDSDGPRETDPGTDSTSRPTSAEST